VPVFFHFTYIASSKAKVVAIRKKIILEKGFTEEKV
jgi:hypothetical protein